MLDQLLTYEQQTFACKYSAFIVCVAAIVIGMKAFDRDLIADMLEEPAQLPATQKQKYVYTILLVSGLICAWCHYMKKF